MSPFPLDRTSPMFPQVLPMAAAALVAFLGARYYRSRGRPDAASSRWVSYALVGLFLVWLVAEVVIISTAGRPDAGPFKPAR